MRTTLPLIITLILLMPLKMFSQPRNYTELRTTKLMTAITNPKSILIELLKDPSRSDINTDKKFKNLVNKTICNNGFLLEEVVGQYWSGINWVDHRKTTYTYDENNNMIEQLGKYYNVPNWVNNWKESYAYDQNNNRKEGLWQIWDGASWVNSGKLKYSYDENNNMIEWLQQAWDDSNWVNNWWERNTYDENNNMIEGIWQIWDGANWVNDIKWTYFYNKDKKIEEFWQTWDGLNWLNDCLIKYTYDDKNNMSEMLEQYWSGFEWVNDHNEFYDYDENNNMTEELSKKWDGLMWKNFMKGVYTYDENNNMIEWLRQDWEDSIWMDSYKNIYKYISITGIEQLTDIFNNYILSNNYPNPFNPTTTIEFELPETVNATLKIYNILGEEVATLVSDRLTAGSYNYDWSRPAGMASGVYLYRLSVGSLSGKAGEYVETKKMVLMR